MVFRFAYLLSAPTTKDMVSATRGIRKTSSMSKRKSAKPLATAVPVSSIYTQHELLVQPTLPMCASCLHQVDQVHVDNVECAVDKAAFDGTRGHVI